MKKILYFLTGGLLLIAGSACNDGMNEVFDREASERMELTLQEIRTTLCSSTSGWVLDYFMPETEAHYAVSILCNFREDGTTEMSRLLQVIEDKDTTVLYDTKIASRYEVQAGAGPVISFSTYNRILHTFADPQTNGVGNKGDYEFVVVEMSRDHLLLRGKKHGATCSLWRLEEGTDWAEYLKQVEAMNEVVSQTIQTTWRKKMINFNGRSEIVHHDAKRGLKFPEEYSSLGYIDYITTNHSIRLQNPLQVDGKPVFEFVPNAELTEFRAVGTDVTLTKGSLILNEQLHYNSLWGFSGPEICDLLKEDWKEVVYAVPGMAMSITLSTGVNSNTHPVVTIHFILVFSLFPAHFYYEFIPVEGTEDLITLRYTNRYDNAMAYLFNNSANPNGIRKLVPMFGGPGSESITFRLSILEGPAEQPLKVQFTNIENPEHYFIGHWNRRLIADF